MAAGASAQYPAGTAAQHPAGADTQHPAGAAAQVRFRKSADKRLTDRDSPEGHT